MIAMKFTIELDIGLSLLLQVQAIVRPCTRRAEIAEAQPLPGTLPSA